jgi:nitroreductase
MSFHDLVRQRRSCRSYKPDPVPRDLIEKTLEAARHAPSACDRQPWRLAVVTAEEKREAIVRDALLPVLQLRWVITAPVIIVLGMTKSLIAHRVGPAVSGIDYPLLDMGIAGEHLVLQAAELELGTCWVGWIRSAVVRRIVGWPRVIEPVSIITLGWPADEAGERSPRKPLSEIADWIEA